MKRLITDWDYCDLTMIASGFDLEFLIFYLVYIPATINSNSNYATTNITEPIEINNIQLNQSERY